MPRMFVSLYDVPMARHWQFATEHRPTSTICATVARSLTIVDMSACDMSHVNQSEPQTHLIRLQWLMHIGCMVYVPVLDGMKSSA